VEDIFRLDCPSETGRVEAKVWDLISQDNRPARMNVFLVKSEFEECGTKPNCPTVMKKDKLPDGTIKGEGNGNAPDKPSAIAGQDDTGGIYYLIFFKTNNNRNRVDGIETYKGEAYCLHNETGKPIGGVSFQLCQDENPPANQCP
jgi:hypothetical protein